MRRAVSSHVNRAARARPASRSRAASDTSVVTRSNASAMPATERGSTGTAASPATSGSDDDADTTVGTPRAIASSTGSPNPSYSDGYTNVSAPR